MKRCSIAMAFVAVFVLLLTLPTAAPAAPPSHNAIPAAAAPRAKASDATPAPHPEIRAAMDALRNAQDSLQHANHDFGGHRVAAMKHIDAAMHELEMCMKYR
jgi:hypothetical protein